MLIVARTNHQQKPTSSTGNEMLEIKDKKDFLRIKRPLLFCFTTIFNAVLAVLAVWSVFYSETPTSGVFPLPPGLLCVHVLVTCRASLVLGKNALRLVGASFARECQVSLLFISLATTFCLLLQSKTLFCSDKAKYIRGGTPLFFSSLVLYTVLSLLYLALFFFELIRTLSTTRWPGYFRYGTMTRFRNLPQSASENECGFCQHGFSSYDKVWLLPCKHKYHWLCLKNRVKALNFCPLCKKKIYTKLRDIYKKYIFIEMF